MRYDKYDSKDGGFRARLAADYSDVDTLVGVGLDVNGRVVVAAGNSGIVGVMSVPEAKVAGDVVDIMTDGEVVDAEGLSAGTVYFAAAADGALSTTNTGTRIGHTVEADRIVVRVAR